MKDEYLCTWEGCRENWVHFEVAQDNEIWARLCCFHHDALEAAIESGKIPVILAIWVRAQGGPKESAARMLGKKTYKSLLGRIKS